MQTVKVLYQQPRVLGLYAHMNLEAVAIAYAADGLVLRYRRYPKTKNPQSNFGYKRIRDGQSK